MHTHLSETDKRGENQKEKARQGGAEANCIHPPISGLRLCSWEAAETLLKVHRQKTFIA